MALTFGGSKKTRSPQLPSPISAGQIIDEATGSALRSQGQLVPAQFELFPGYKAALDLYTQRLSQPVPEDILGDVAGRFRAEQALASPGSTASPAGSINRAVAIQRYIEGERERAAGQVQGLSSRFMLDPLGVGQAAGIGQGQESLRLGQANQQAGFDFQAQMANQARQQQQQEAIGSLVGMGAAAAAPFVFPALGGALGRTAGGFSQPQNFANLLGFMGAGSQFGGAAGRVF